MLVCMATYTLVWQVGNKRSLRKEQDRIEALRASGHLKSSEKSPVGGEQRVAAG